MTINDNICALRQKIAAATLSAKRPADSARLIAVAKTFNSRQIRAAYDAGIAHVGENYIQEAIGKIQELSDINITWHFIGHLQRNKTAIAARHFDWIHTVDSALIARRLSSARDGSPPINICLQVNIDDEKTKSGILPEDTAALVQEIALLPNIKLRGLMIIASPHHQNKRAPYRAAALLRQNIIAQTQIPLDVLSMGMSEDFEAAIAEGATHIRIGQAIFGHREKKGCL